jgi:protein-S-isoprenylcysteine O-methyltransferase Ste14
LIFNTSPIVEKVAILALTAIFLILFIGRNVVLKRKIGKSVRGSGISAPVIFSFVLFTVTNFAVLDARVYRLLVPVGVLSHGWIALSGYVLLAVSVVFGALVSRQMRDSWRVGIQPNDRTELMQTGVFSVIRNPYFLTYYAMFISFFIIKPAVVLLVLVLSTILAYHRMVHREERHLHRVHGQSYADYVKRTGRYLPKMSHARKRVPMER